MGQQGLRECVFVTLPHQPHQCPPQRPTAAAPALRIPIMCLLVVCCIDHCNLPVGSKACFGIRWVQAQALPATVYETLDM